MLNFEPELPTFETPQKKMRHPFLETPETENIVEPKITQQQKEETPSRQEDKYRRPFFTRPKASMLDFSKIAQYKILKPDTEKIITADKTKIPARPFNCQDAPSFESSPAIREGKELTFALKIKDQAEANIRLFKSGDIEKIIDFLESDVIDLEFQREINKTKEEYGQQLAFLDFLTNKHWKILTGMKIFSKEVFEHQIATCLIAKEKMERLPKLKQAILNEGVTISQFNWGGIAHDCGKIGMPDFILENKTTDSEWVYYFMELPEEEQDSILADHMIIVPDAIRHDLGEMTDFFAEKRIRAVEFVPAKTILTEQQIILLEKNGLNPHDSLKEIMQLHEKKSEYILRKLGYVIEAMLAGNHHNHKHTDKKLGEKPVSLTTLHISTKIAETILHLSDVQQALNVNRSYHRKQPMLRILAFLVDDAKAGKILPELTAIWIKDELSKMSPHYLDEIRDMNAEHQSPEYRKQRKEELEFIEEFIGDHSNDNSIFEGNDLLHKNAHADSYHNHDNEQFEQDFKLTF